MASCRPQKKARTEPPVVFSLQRLDPILQFLTRATGNPTVPLATVLSALPQSNDQQEELLRHLPELARRGVLQLTSSVPDCDPSTLETVLLDSAQNIKVGFPPPPSLDDDAKTSKEQSQHGTLHGSTKTAAKRRLAALRKSLKNTPIFCDVHKDDVTENDNETVAKQPATTFETPKPKIVAKRVTPEVTKISSSFTNDCDDVDQSDEEARKALTSLFNFVPPDENMPHSVGRDIHYPLPRQASYADSKAGRVASYGELSRRAQSQIEPVLLEAFGFGSERRLYTHQADAINSAMDGVHTIVCTGTGSGKSLCFLLPVLAAAMANENSTSLLLFPTKALAQDQFSKLKALIEKNSKLSRIVPGIIDGDVSHAQRSFVTKSCNVILTNPDTLHAAILPNWKALYKPLLERVQYVILDEAHMYEGIFGAHVSMVLSRLLRLCLTFQRMPTFLACSATLFHPEQHFRSVCPIHRDAPIKVVKDDGSPCSPKYFFVWNPPIMNVNGGSTGRVTIPHVSSKTKNQAKAKAKTPTEQRIEYDDFGVTADSSSLLASDSNTESHRGSKSIVPVGAKKWFRRHAAEETALLLARAVSNNVRCIVFCKTRCLVEWVYERTIAALKSNGKENLASLVESYRGGYTAEARRCIEQRLFQNKLLGVVGTSALELGVDIGGIDLTLHCGYPTSYSSLLQQAGRAGRGGSLQSPSVAVMICFNSPCEQHIWRHPSSLLSKGISSPLSIPLNTGLVQGHLLCAGQEFPLGGDFPIARVANPSAAGEAILPVCDNDLFGSTEVYEEAQELLVSKDMLRKENISVGTSNHEVAVFKTHPFIDKPWSRVSLRSIEPINYSIVDASHPQQGGKMDSIHEDAILDTIPYSRVFYHAFPGAIIIHRGRKYEVQCMTRPSPFAESRTAYRGSCNLGAFAKPTQKRYFTRPLSKLHITIVKQMERVDVALLRDEAGKDNETNTIAQSESLAGNGVITVKREVHGYKKLSPVTRVELSRTEISLPPMEYDTFALWLDTEAPTLSCTLLDYNEGVHALSHALLAVAPLFVQCCTSDLDCDHRYYDCSRVILFDGRAGGSGTCAQLWKFLFRPKGLLSAAIDLLETCNSCDADSRYEGGCPACIQSGRCLKFNQHLSRSSALVIAKRMLARIERTSLYEQNAMVASRDERVVASLGDSAQTTSPRRKAREKALRSAKDLATAKERQIVVGRPTWPFDSGGRVGGNENAM